MARLRLLDIGGTLPFPCFDIVLFDDSTLAGLHGRIHQISVQVEAMSRRLRRLCLQSIVLRRQTIGSFKLGNLRDHLPFFLRRVVFFNLPVYTTRHAFERTVG